MSVEVTADGHVLVVTLNRPEARNAIDEVMTRGIEEAVDRLEDDDDLWVGIVAAVPPVFSAGADLRMVGAGEGGRLVTERGGFAGFTRRSRTKPVIAAVDGPALAGGCEIVLACDLVVASPAARFGLPEVKRSLVAAGGGVFRLPRRIPVNVAMECVLTGDPIEADYAHRLGLVNHLVDPGEALVGARALAGRIVANAPVALRAARRVVLETALGSEEEAWSASEQALAAAMGSEDFAEGVTAFLEKRSPTWSGR